MRIVLFLIVAGILTCPGHAALVSEPEIVTLNTAEAQEYIGPFWIYRGPAKNITMKITAENNQLLGQQGDNAEFKLYSIGKDEFVVNGYKGNSVTFFRNSMGQVDKLSYRENFMTWVYKKGEPSSEKVEIPKHGWLIDDFEDGNRLSEDGLPWSLVWDKNKLGTKISPFPLRTIQNGAPQSPKHALHMEGVMGESRAPWPWAWLEVNLTHEQSVDLNHVDRIEFWTRGDGKEYKLALSKAVVNDNAQFRISFKTSDKWEKVVCRLDDFKQPTDWGKKIDRDFSDVMTLRFNASHLSKQKFSLSVDDIRLFAKSE